MGDKTGGADLKNLEGLGKSLFYISFPISFMAFILPIYATNMGASPIEVGLLYSVFSLFSILARPFVGVWIDKAGRKKGFIVGLIAYVVVMVLFMIGNSYKYILVARIVQSIASSFMWISVFTMIADVSDSNNKSKNLGHIDQLANRGEMIGSAIGFTVFFSGQFHDPFKYIFMIYIVFSILGLYYGITKAKETLQEVCEPTKDIIEPERLGGKFIKFLVIMGILSFVSSMIAPIFLLYLREHITKDLTLLSFLFLPTVILSTFLPRKFGQFADKYGRKKMLVVGMLLQSLFVVFIPFVKDYYGFMALYSFFSASAMLRFPAQTALVTEITGNRKRGKNYGLYCFATGLGGIIGPILGSSIYQHLGNEIIFYVQGGTLLIVAMVISSFLRSKQLKSSSIYGK